MKTFFCFLCAGILLLGCSKNETPPDQPSIPEQESPSDSATALVTMVRNGQKILVNVYNPDGIKRWSANNDKYGGMGIRPSYADGKLYATFGDSLFAYDIKGGAMLWRKKYWFSAVAAPTAYNGVLYVPSQNTLFELSPLDGSLLKKHSIGQLVYLPVFIKDSIVYLFTATSNAFYSIRAYDLKNQTFKWSTGIGINPPIGVSLVGDNLIFRNDFTYYLKAIDIKTGQSAWTRDDAGYSQHVIYGDRIYAVPQGGSEYLNINAIDAKTGSRVWKWIQNKVTSGITDIYLYKDQVNFMIYEPNNKVAYIAVKNSNGDSLWRKERALSNVSYASAIAGDRLYRYEGPVISNEKKIVIYDTKTFSPVDSSDVGSNYILHLMVIKKSDN